MLNAALCALTLGGIGYGGYIYYQSLSGIKDDDMFEDEYTDVITLKNKISKEFSGMLKENFREKNLSKSELERKQKSKHELRKYLKEAAYGNSKAKKYVKLYIKAMLTNQDLKLGVNENTIDEIIPFEKPDELKNQDKFEIVLYIAYNLLLDAKGRPCKENGFAKIIKDYNVLDRVNVNGEMMYDFTPEKLDEIYHDIINQVELSYNDKLEILSQRIFELYKGFGAADLLFDTAIDEVEAGVSGISKDGYDIQNSRNLTYTYQSIWVIVRGIKLRMSCLSFGSQEELVRVVNNIYKFGANRVLSRKYGYVISTMKSGNRIVVMRPPFANTFAFLARKFDSAPSIAPENLLTGNNTIIPITMIKWQVIGLRNIYITGEQGCGKSTMLKSFVRYIDAALSIRLQEKSAELNLNYSYPYRNIISFQETESIDSQEGLNLQKKSSGDVNIIGESAEAIHTVYAVQVSMVASRQLLTTYHGKTPDDTVVSNANNLLDPVVGIYKEKKEAIEIMAKVINNDIHCANERGHRFIERMTEIIPVQGIAYPSESDPSKNINDDMLEYFKRQTDRVPYEKRQLFHFDNGEYILDNLPSDMAMAQIRKNLNEYELQMFEDDMEMLKNLPRAPYHGDYFSTKPVTVDPDFVQKGA